MSDLFRTLIIAASDATLAREIAASFGSGGAGMWITPLSAGGEEPASYYISSGYIPAEFVSLAPLTTWAWDAETGTWVAQSSEPGDAAAVYAYASQAGVSCTIEDVEGIFSRADVSDQPPFVAMGRMGLTIINPPLEL